MIDIRSPAIRALASGLSAASLLLPLSMLVQLVVSLATDRSTSWWGLLTVRLSNTSTSSSVDLGVDGLATATLWLVVVVVFGGLGLALARRASRASRP